MCIYYQLPQTNVSVLADMWLWFRGVTAVSTSLAAYSCYCLSLHSRKTGSKEEEEMGPWKARHQQRREKPRRGEECGRTTGKRGGITQSFLQKQKRYEYSNFTLLIRDGCLFLWGTALLVFVSSLIICMMYSTALYSVMGERWRSARLTMRPKGHRSRHSQPYSVQRSKATLLYPKLVTISQSLKLQSNNSTYLHSTKTSLFPERLGTWRDCCFGTTAYN